MSQDAMLKMTKTKIEFIPDPDMYIFFEKGTTGKILIFLIDTAKPMVNI